MYRFIYTSGAAIVVKDFDLGKTEGNIGMALLVLSALLFTLLAVDFLIERIRGGKHAWYKKTARKIYKRINAGNFSGAQIITYLRKINPYVFEELVLYAFSQKGYEVKPNERYSGDGGVDGHVRVDGEWRPIQCKRYGKYISLQHLQQFARLCMADGVKGYFVHTGRTGKGTRKIAFESDFVEVISGDKLVKLIKTK